MNTKQMVELIKYDIDRGVYTNFPMLKWKLQYIVDKLINSKYIINSIEITRTEMQILKDNDYI